MLFDLYSFSMEKTKDRTDSLSSPFFIVIDCFLFQKITNWVNGTYHGFASRYWSFPTDENAEAFSEKNSELQSKNQQNSSSEKKDDADEKLSGGEVKMVMENLGIFCSDESEESLSFDSITELSKLFDEKEPTMEEVKEAFDVFDVNRDGFIDTMELQRVLRILGLKEGGTIENCKKMIERFDENKDGRIDFEEFAKFMESAF